MIEDKFKYRDKKLADRFYQSTVWRKKRLEIIKRDNNECQHCKENGKVSKAEQVHHIVYLEDDSNLALEDDNLISLCLDCHNHIHKRFGHSEKKNTFWVEEWW